MFYTSDRTRLQPAIFFDRDGIINEVVMRDGATCSPHEASAFRFKPGFEKPSKPRGMQVSCESSSPTNPMWSAGRFRVKNTRPCKCSFAKP
jgi:hypothetical protein